MSDRDRFSALRAPIFTVSALAILAGTSPAIAQEVDPDDRMVDDQRIEDTIIVTGTKRESTLQDTDVSVTVLDREALDNARVSDIRRIDDLVPNVQFNESGQLGGVYVTIRGVESNPFIVNRAAIYIDGIPFRELTNSVLSQLESVEVLRGPQATLYGANSESGLIVIRTRAPGEQFEISTGLTATTFETGESYNGELYIGGPLVGDQLAGSLSLKYGDEDYYIKNIGDTPQGQGQIDEIFAQGRLRWTPNDRLTVNATGYIVDTDAPGIYRFDGYPVDLERYNAVYSDGLLFDPADPFSPPPVNGDLRASDFTFVNNAPKRALIDETAFGISASYDLGGGKLEASISTRTEDIDDRGFDLDNSNGPFLAGAVTEEKEVYNAEIRFQSSDERSLQYTLGVSAYLEDEREALGSLIGPGLLQDFQFAPEQSGEARDYGVFANVSYSPAWLDKLTATLGIRYDQATRSTLQQAGELELGNTVFVFDDVDLEETFDAALPRIALRYEPTDDFTVFASIAKGYIPGGFNLTAAQQGFQDDVIRYESEELWNYEAGLRWRSPDGRARGSAAIFYIEADNWQEISALEDEQGNVVSTSFISTRAAIESQGFEIEGSWQPFDNLLLTANLGIVEADYTDFAESDAQVIGNPVKLVSEYDGNIAARYEWAGGWFVRGEVNLLGDTPLDEGNREGFDVNALDTQEAVEIYGLQAGYDGERFSALVFVDNLTDERRISGAAFPTTFFPSDGVLYAAVDAPRVVGLELGFDY